MSKAVAGTLIKSFSRHAEEKKMADEFRILVHRNEESAHFKLMGEFDEKAAIELLDTLRRYSGGASKIFIHTDSLDGISEYSEQNLKNGLLDGSKNLAAKILTTGRFGNLFTNPSGRPN
jgi:hypothetical protein